MSLEKNKSKLNFDDSPDSSFRTGINTGKLIFVVQRHHASHLHYDFRLELNGVLRSWAIPKGPSLNPKDKRLAMMVEDHPLDYASFEGNIPAGNYGAGRVDTWDKGTYTPVNENGKVITTIAFISDLQKGSARFRLNGKLLKGDFSLVHMKKDERTWLLIKHKDKYSTDDEYNSEMYASKEALVYTARRNKGNKT